MSECSHSRLKPEDYRGGFAPNPDGDYHTLGCIEGYRCQDCGEWLANTNNNFPNTTYEVR